jgi:hypothetical protein
MPLRENDIKALVLIAGSEEPVNPGALQAELGRRREDSILALDKSDG